ncbi:MAG: bifunctional riboflavin kinase/FAD synthetase [Chitinophagaceae bacterium]|nr:bifunctional riboflavin kinase/FAD synthetase [Chitinophagaceae bacterium]
MQVHSNLENLPVFEKAIITIGTFDGVHTGHRQIISQLKKEAKKAGGETVIITFHPHPRKIVNTGNNPVKILSTLEEKIELLEKEQIDHLVIVPFNESFAEQSAETYVHEFLFKKFHPHSIIIGYDHKFGKGRTGNYKLLEAFADELNFRVIEIPGHVIDEVTISSTRIRQAIISHDIETANHFLGYDYFFEGIVVKGDRLGRTLGYPTANLKIQNEEKLIPANGIYAVEVFLENEEKKMKGMMSIGVRPTINDNNIRAVEVNIFDFDKDIYGEVLQVHVKHFIRQEEKFDDLQQLIKKIGEDKAISQKLLG